MIITRLIGGLGNQMFQYAVGRRIAHERGIELKLDLTDFADYPLRKYELHKLNIRAEIASREEIDRRINPSGITGFKAGLDRLLKPYYRQAVVRERSFRFDRNIFCVRSEALIIGYWQSEKYFKDIEEVIRREFAIKETVENSEIESMIRETNAVSVHVRRGDYVENPVTNRYHGLCSLEYYRTAAGMIRERVANPFFFIFSDDLDWCGKNLDVGKDVCFVEGNSGGRSHLDMRLMSLCSHHIIANSSFSWWGAWLSPRKDKVVIAPSRWFRKDGIDTSDLIPEQWFRIESD